MQFSVGEGQLNIISPANTTVAPPGYYMLFAIDNRGVPSVAKMVNVSPRTTFSSGIRAKHSEKCLAIPEGRTDDGLQLQQITCSETSFQRFRFQLVSGTSNTYQINNLQTGKCIDVSGSSQNDGTPIAQLPCTASLNQQFRLQGTGNGFYQLVAQHSND